mgnify:CR=1 FL=1
MFALYTFQMGSIKAMVAFFGECLRDKRPKLYKHLKELGVDYELFLIEWAYTMYSRAFSLRIVSYLLCYAVRFGTFGLVRVSMCSSRWGCRSWSVSRGS